MEEILKNLVEQQAVDRADRAAARDRQDAQNQLFNEKFLQNEEKFLKQNERLERQGEAIKTAVDQLTAVDTKIVIIEQKIANVESQTNEKMEELQGSVTTLASELRQAVEKMESRFETLPETQAQSSGANISGDEIKIWKAQSEEYNQGLLREMERVDEQMIRIDAIERRFETRADEAEAVRVGIGQVEHGIGSLNARMAELRKGQGNCSRPDQQLHRASR
jgi:chromosome segregation ATPase